MWKLITIKVYWDVGQQINIVYDVKQHILSNMMLNDNGVKPYLWEPLCAVVDTPSLEYLCNTCSTIVYTLKDPVFTLQHNIQS